MTENNFTEYVEAMRTLMESQFKKIDREADISGRIVHVPNTTISLDELSIILDKPADKIDIEKVVMAYEMVGEEAMCAAFDYIKDIRNRLSRYEPGRFNSFPEFDPEDN